MSEDVSRVELLGRVERLERRLEIIRKSISHDLPNQLVAIQGLTQLLSLEESSRFSPDGQEYLRRVGGACTRALEIMHLLKAILKVGTQPEPREAVTLKEVAGTLAAEIKQLSPGTVIEYHFSIDAQEVHASRGCLQQALGGLLRLAATLGGASLVLGSRRAGQEVDIWVGPGILPDSSAAISASSSKEWDNRLEWQLIRELGETGGAVVRLLEEADRGRFFILRVKE
jgi:signal transduction histidine kinase